MIDFTYSEMKQIDMALKAHINEVNALVIDDHFKKEGDRKIIEKWLDAAKSAQEKIQEYTKE
ncbi:hypothetical protein ACIOBL_01345 [Paenibacillus taichungensis]|uniref:hypothetical protein n=1 Tax=Paenibacillus taichungensis TaxID=484184 RepID=UPI0037F72B88